MHVIVYAIDVSGVEFRRRVGVGSFTDLAATDGQDECISDEGKIPGSDESIAAKLSAQVTLLWLAVKETRLLLNCAPEVARVERFENALRGVFPDVEIVRLGELTLEVVERGIGDGWRHKDTGMLTLKRYLLGLDPSDWPWRSLS